MIRVRLVANAGVQIEYEKKKILVDALHYEESSPFSKVTPDMCKKMSHEDSPFHNADYIIFTHEDSDHYTPSVLLDYLQQNQSSKIFLPVEQTGDEKAKEKELKQFLESNTLFYEYLDIEFGEEKEIILDSQIKMLVKRVKHLPKVSKCTECDCILLNFRDKNILFTSDCDFDDIDAFSFLKRRKIDLVFVNPMFFYNQKGREILKRYMEDTHIILYHVPFEEDDQYQMRGLVKQSMKKFSGEFLDVQAMTEAGTILEYY